MEGGHSGTQRDGEREDINCAVRQLGQWLLRYCVITGLHLTLGAAALGAADAHERNSDVAAKILITSVTLKIPRQN